MKRIPLLLALFIGCASLGARGEDAATEERLNKLSGQIEDLIAAQEVSRKKLSELAREIESVRNEQSKPVANNYASTDDLKRLADSVKEVDRKRLDDYEKIRTEIMKLRDVLATPAPAASRSNRISSPKANENARNTDKEKPSGDQKGYEYKVQSGDTLSLIIQAYKAKNIRVTADQIIKANPGLKPDRLRPGQTIFIPAPGSN